MANVSGQETVTRQETNREDDQFIDWLWRRRQEGVDSFKIDCDHMWLCGAVLVSQTMAALLKAFEKEGEDERTLVSLMQWTRVFTCQLDALLAIMMMDLDSALALIEMAAVQARDCVKLAQSDENLALWKGGRAAASQEYDGVFQWSKQDRSVKAAYELHEYVANWSGVRSGRQYRDGFVAKFLASAPVHIAMFIAAWELMIAILNSWHPLQKLCIDTLPPHCKERLSAELERFEKAWSIVMVKAMSENIEKLNAMRRRYEEVRHLSNF